MSHPYKNLPDRQFWKRGVSGVVVHEFDPVSQCRFQIEPTSRVATAGSCFAQHISRRLAGIGFNYFVVEDGEGKDDTERARGQYGVFSARYGNLYTTAQLRQLFEEAFGQRQPLDDHLVRADGRIVDMFRQQIEPDGFSDVEAMRAERQTHLAAMRRMFLEADVFVFTLGLTEAWRDRRDGSVIPTAPGVVAGTFDPDRYEFINFGVAEVDADLEAFLVALKTVNPAIKVLLTVSPVPLIATYEDRHVLVATTYSKSVLRVVAEMAIARHDWVDYFPSYEIITGSPTGGLYYESDRREVNALGVAHAMRCFLDNYTASAERKVPSTRPTARQIAQANPDGVVCDEEVLNATRA